VSEGVGVRLTERSLRIPISDDIGEAICFYNPYVRRFYCFQFAYVDRFFRIVRYLRRLCLCVTCTFKSVDARRHWSKNIYVESMVCKEITDAEYKAFRSPAELWGRVLSIHRELTALCGDCFDLFAVNYEVRGFELRIRTCYSYCCCDRLTAEEEVVKTKCYGSEYWNAPTPIRTDIRGD
jgi:hypothetical protein